MVKRKFVVKTGQVRRQDTERKSTNQPPPPKPKRVSRRRYPVAGKWVTKIQHHTLTVIRRLYCEEGWTPSVERLSSALGVSLQTVRERLTALEKKGLIKIDVSSGVLRMWPVGLRVVGTFGLTNEQQAMLDEIKFVE